MSKYKKFINPPMDNIKEGPSILMDFSTYYFYNPIEPDSQKRYTPKHGTFNILTAQTYSQSERSALISNFNPLQAPLVISESELNQFFNKAGFAVIIVSDIDINNPDSRKITLDIVDSNDSADSVVEKLKTKAKGSKDLFFIFPNAYFQQSVGGEDIKYRYRGKDKAAQPTLLVNMFEFLNDKKEKVPMPNIGFFLGCDETKTKFYVFVNAVNVNDGNHPLNYLGKVYTTDNALEPGGDNPSGGIKIPDPSI